MLDAARLEAIEVKLAHLERALSEISDVVIRQQKELELATARHQRLSDQLAMLESEGASNAAPQDSLAQEKPPHY